MSEGEAQPAKNATRYARRHRSWVRQPKVERARRLKAVERAESREALVEEVAHQRIALDAGHQGHAGAKFHHRVPRKWLQQVGLVAAKILPGVEDPRPPDPPGPRRPPLGVNPQPVT